jgi:hypothetical protein
MGPTRTPLTCTSGVPAQHPRRCSMQGWRSSAAARLPKNPPLADVPLLIARLAHTAHGVNPPELSPNYLQTPHQPEGLQSTTTGGSTPTRDCCTHKESHTPQQTPAGGHKQLYSSLSSKARLLGWKCLKKHLEWPRPELYLNHQECIRDTDVPGTLQ